MADEITTDESHREPAFDARTATIGRVLRNHEESTVRIVVDGAGDVFLYVDEPSGTDMLIIAPASTDELRELRAVLNLHLAKLAPELPDDDGPMPFEPAD